VEGDADANVYATKGYQVEFSAGVTTYTAINMVSYKFETLTAG
jgi:hypothetical protein